MKLAVGLAGGAFLILALGLAAWFGAGFLHRDPPQQRTQLTVMIDNDAVPRMVVRTLFEAVRDGMREPRMGFASIAPSGDSVEVTIVEGVDREQALARLHELSHTGSTDGTHTESFAIADASGAMLRLTRAPAAHADGLDRAVDQTIDVLGQRIDRLGLKPKLNREGDDRIVIEVLSEPDTTRLKAFIVTPGKLTFRFVDTSISEKE